MIKLYSVHDHWTDIAKKNDVDIESINGVITGIKVNGEDYSGSTWTEIFSGDVVTSGEAAPFSGTINAVLSGSDTIKVFYNDGIYILPKQVTDDGIFYGATFGATPSDIDFSEIPFLIKLGEVNTALYTQSPGPQDITILEPQSGGGSSDFSTAEVTFKGEASAAMPLIVTKESGSSVDAILVTQRPFGNASYPIALYKGNAIILVTALEEGKVITISGGGESLGDDMYLITGDCTITIS